MNSKDMSPASKVNDTKIFLRPRLDEKDPLKLSKQGHRSYTRMDPLLFYVLVTPVN